MFFLPLTHQQENGRKRRRHGPWHECQDGRDDRHWRPCLGHSKERLRVRHLQAIRVRCRIVVFTCAMLLLSWNGIFPREVLGYHYMFTSTSMFSAFVYHVAHEHVSASFPSFPAPIPAKDDPRLPRNLLLSRAKSSLNKSWLHLSQSWQGQDFILLMR